MRWAETASVVVISGQGEPLGVLTRPAAEQARDTVAATLRALGFVMPVEEAERAAAQLPTEVAGSLTVSAGSVRPD